MELPRTDPYDPRERVRKRPQHTITTTSVQPIDERPIKGNDKPVAIVSVPTPWSPEMIAGIKAIATATAVQCIALVILLIVLLVKL